VVARFVIPKKFARTTEAGIKPDPVSVTVTGSAPTVAEVGVIEFANGLGLFTATETPCEVPPPGGGFTAVTAAFPSVEVRLAAVEKTIDVEVREVIETPAVVPFQSTVVEALNPVPESVKTPDDPPRMVVGVIPETETDGLGTVNVLPFEVCWSGLRTEIVFVPATARRAEETVTPMVEAATELTAIDALAPFQRTVAPEANPVPEICTVVLPTPAVTPDGFKAVIVGGGLLIVRFTAEDVPPTGAGLTTVTGSVPGVERRLDEMIAVTVLAESQVVGRATVPR
jgi:hypothetical protein